MLEICRCLRSIDIPIHTLQPIIQHRIIMSDCAKVAFKMLDIDCIETNQCSIESNIQLGDLFPEYKRTAILSDEAFELIQCSKNRYNIFVIVFLCGSESSFVDASVYVGLHPWRDFVDFRPQMGWVQID